MARLLIVGNVINVGGGVYASQDGRAESIEERVLREREFVW